LETNPGLVDAPAPSAGEFEAAAEQSISLEDLAPPPVAEERRAVKRFPVRIPLLVHDGKAPVRGRSENLGRGGIFVTAERPFAPGTALRIRLDLPVPGEGHNEIAVHVVHATSSGGVNGFGLHFDDMSAETARRLDAFLEELARPSQSRPFLVVASLTLSAEVERVAQSYRDEEVRVRLVTPADNVQEIAEADPPDLMLLDLADPVMVAFVGALKATRSTSGIPVALVDKAGTPQSALLAAAAGADRFFSLPGELMPLIGFSVEKLAASRRRSVRARFQRPVALWVRGAQINAAAMDLSETGMQVRTAGEVAEGEILEAVVALSDGAPPARLNAKVAWKTPATDGGAMKTRLGLAFDVDDATRSRIRAEVRNALSASFYVRWLSAAPRVLPAPGIASRG
ncbi:MAG TPA: PilZ domain-containing protein, partial [bacterium]|nr:PilZ domain-containing protein [bacterium]